MEKKESKKTVRTFALASFLNDLGSEMIYPVWPLFVTTVLGANMTVLGLIDGLGDALVSISQAISGYASDRIRRRKIFVWLGYLFGSLSRVGYALSTAWQQLIPFRILDRAGKMRGAPRDAIIADVSSKHTRGKNFGIVRTMDNLGGMCGIIFSILFISLLGYRNLFMIAAIPSAVGVLLILFVIKERHTKHKLYKGMSFRDLDSNFRLFLILSSVFALGAFSYSFLLIFANRFGFDAIFIPVLYLIFTAFAALSSFPFGRMSDRIGRKPVLMLSFALWGIICLSFIFIHSELSILAAFILYGFHKGGLDTVQKTFVSELSPEKYRASGLGGFQMAVGLCALPASLIAGALWDSISMEAPFYFSLALTAIAVAALTFVKEK